MYIPVKINKNILSNIEKENCEIIVPRLVYNNPNVELNDTARYIMKCINGKNTIKDIVENVKSHYNIQSEKNIDIDVNNILYQLWRIGIVGWNENNNPYNTKFSKSIKNYSINLVTLETINEFLLESKDNYYEYCNPYRYKKKIINKNYLEQAVVNNFSYNFYVKNNEKKVISIMVTIDFQELVITIDYINISDINIYNEIAKETFIEFIEWIEEKIIQSGIYIPKNFNKINWLLLLDEYDKEFITIVEKFNYSKKILLKDETVNGNVYLYFFERDLKKRFKN